MCQFVVPEFVKFYKMVLISGLMCQNRLNVSGFKFEARQNEKDLGYTIFLKVGLEFN